MCMIILIEELVVIVSTLFANQASSSILIFTVRVGVRVSLLEWTLPNVDAVLPYF